MDIKDNIPLTYKELGTIFKQEWSRFKQKERKTEIRPFLLREDAATMKPISTSSVQPKRKPGRLRQDQSKESLTNWVKRQANDDGHWYWWDEFIGRIRTYVDGGCSEKE